MTLSETQIKLLANPFRLEDHAFTPKKHPYLRKAAIRRRLDEVCPGWSSTEPKLLYHYGNVVVLTGGLTLGGETRYGVGTGIIQELKTGEENQYKADQNVARAFKIAASDIVPRAALEFRVGWYLKELPKDANGNSTITNSQQLAAHLKTLETFTPPPPPLPVQPPLTEDDRQVIDGLCQKYLDLSAEKALASLELPKWDEFCRMFPSLDGALKAIANRLADQKRAVTVYQATTKAAPNKERSLYLSLNFGFADVAIFEREIADVFPTQDIVGDWKHLDAVRAFTPPLRVILNRNERGFPKASYAEQVDAPEEEKAPVASPLS